MSNQLWVSMRETKRPIPNPSFFRRLRWRVGLSQAAASLAVGKSHGHCGHTERGRYGMSADTFRLYMVAFGAGPFDILRCLGLNPFDDQVVKRFERRCRDEGKDPAVVLQLLMRFYAQ